MKKILFSVFIFINLTSLNLISQDLKETIWGEYKTKFSTPSDFTINQNDAEKFLAQNSQMTLTIFTKKGENYSTDQMLDAVQLWADNNNIEDQGGLIELNDSKLHGYWGYFIEGYKDGKPVVLLLFNNPNSPEISFYVWLTYLEGLEDLSMKIITSFSPN